MYNKRLEEIPLNELVPNRFQPRIHFNEEKIEDLAKSIVHYGVLEPIIVRELGGKYEIIAGERRFKASKLAGKSTIPAIVVDFNDKESIELALLENMQRQELTAIEEAIAYRRILDMGQITQEELAKKMGKSQPAIANKMRLLALDDETQDALINHKISERHARSLLKLIGTGKELEMLNRIISERLTVRDTDREIAKIMEKKENYSTRNKDNSFIKPDDFLPKKESKEVSLIDDIDLAIAKIEENLTKINERKGENTFMDIEKIMQEAQDINAKEEPKDLNKFVTTPSPYDTILGNIEQPVNDIADIMDIGQPAEQNKFVNFVEPEEKEEPKEEPQPVANFDSVFNSTFDIPTLKEPSISETKIQNVTPLEPTYSSPMESINLETIPEEEKAPEEIEEIFVESPIYDKSVTSNAVFINEPTMNSIQTPVNSMDYTINQQDIELPVSSEIELPTGEVMSEIPEFTSTIAESAPNFENNVPENSTSDDITNFKLDETPVYTVSRDEEKVNIPEKPTAISYNTIESLDLDEEKNVQNEFSTDTKINENNFSKVLEIIKNCSEQIKELGYEVNTNEFDLENLYQVTIVVNK